MRPFEALRGDQADAEGSPLLSVSCEPLGFAEAVLDATSSVIAWKQVRACSDKS
jgi:hypothetical protein